RPARYGSGDAHRQLLGFVPGAGAALRRVGDRGSAALELGEQFRQSLTGVTGATFHTGGDHRVTVLDRLEGRDRAHERAAPAVVEGRGLEGDVAGCAFELEGLHDGLRGRVAVEDAVEAKGVAVSVGVHIP